MRVNVRDMQRVIHRHVFGDRINGRDVCDSCPFRAKRHRTISAFGTKRPAYDFELAEMNKVFANNYNALTVPVLREKVIKRKPNLTGVSKMRKPELIAALLGS